MDSPLCCASCGALSPQSPEEQGFDYFDFFGLPCRYELDTAALHRRYLALSRWIHPDIRVDRSDPARRQALALSAQLNRAYETLRDPVARADYLLSLAGGPSATEDKSVPGPMLNEVVLLREEIEEAAGGQDASALAALRRQVSARRQAGIEEIARLARNLVQNDAVAPEPERRALRQQLNAAKYWNNLLEQLSAAALK